MGKLVYENGSYVTYFTKSEILGYFKPDGNGGFKVVPPWLKEFERPKIRGLAVRNETAKQAADRIVKEIAKNEVKLVKNGQRASDKYIGSVIGKFACAATDGHRAILTMDCKRTKEDWPICKLPDSEREPDVVLNSPEIFNAIQRIVALNKGEVLPHVRITWSAKEGKLVLSTACEELEGKETFVYWGAGEGEVCLNPGYLMCVLGSYPVNMYFDEPKAPVIFECAGREWYYVVMPIAM